MDLLDIMETGIPSSVNIKKNTQRIYTTPIQYSTSDTVKNTQYTFIVDKWLSKNELTYFKKYIVNKGILDFQILVATQIQVDLEKSIAKQFITHRWRFEEYIKPWTKVFTFGRAMFSLCGTTDLDCSVKGNDDTDEKKNLDKNSVIEGFYDTLLEESHFNDPSTKCVVFPVDSWLDLLNKETQFFFDKFETNFFKLQLERAIKTTVKPIKIKKIQKIVVENPNTWMLKQIELHSNDDILAWDLETGSTEENGGLDSWDMSGIVRCFTCAFYNEPYTGYYLDWKKIDVGVLEKFLFHFRHLGTNLNFDYKWLVVAKGLNINIVDRLVFDTIHISQIYNTNQRNSLKSNAWIFTWNGGYDKPLDEYKEKNPVCKKNYARIPDEILVPYASQDPCMSILVHQAQELLIHEIDRLYPVNFIKDSTWSMWKFYTQLRIPTQCVFTEIEIRGISIDWDKVNFMSDKLKTKIKESEDTIRTLLEITDDNFNISSNDQIGIRLEELGIPCFGRSKKNTYLVNSLTLSKWSALGYKWADIIDEYHGLKTLYGTFVGDEKDKTGYFQYRKSDGKVHSNFGVGLNSTGRNNSKNPNLQNLKKHGFFAFESRDFFTPKNTHECCFAEMDGASLQLRIEASLSKDKTMKALFQNDVDMHSLTAHFLFGEGESFEEFDRLVKEGDKKHKNWRSSAKGPNFSLCFNSSANAFSKTTLYEGASYKWSLEQCKEYIDIQDLEDNRIKTYNYLIEHPQHGIDDPEKYSYFLTCGTDIREKWLDKYSGIKHYIAYKIEEGRKYGACFTPFGFIRRVPLLKLGTGKDENKMKIKNAENIMSNVSAQNFEWVLISKTMLKLNALIKEKNLKSKLVGNVHDSLCLVLYYDEAYEITKLAQETFCEDIPENNEIPHGLSIELGVWGFGKEFEVELLKDVPFITEETMKKIEKVRKESLYG